MTFCVRQEVDSLADQHLFEHTLKSTPQENTEIAGFRHKKKGQEFKIGLNQDQQVLGALPDEKVWDRLHPRNKDMDIHLKQEVGYLGIFHIDGDLPGIIFFFKINHGELQGALNHVTNPKHTVGVVPARKTLSGKLLPP